MAQVAKKTRKTQKALDPNKPVPFSRLTKKELKHLREDAGCTTLTQFKLTAAAQKEMRCKGSSEPCYECKFIAKKLGLEV